MLDILLLNGPNLNMLGRREPGVYGKDTLPQIVERMQALVAKAGLSFSAFQSNHEGDLIDKIHQEAEVRFVIINPGAFTHTSVALRDALCVHGTPFIEIHISNTFAREPFRHHSFLSDKAQGVIIGLGVYGYELAGAAAIKHLTQVGK